MATGEIGLMNGNLLRLELKRLMFKVWDDVMDFGNEFNQAVITSKGKCSALFFNDNDDEIHDTESLLRYLAKDCIESGDTECYFDVKCAIEGLQDGEVLYIAYGLQHYTDHSLIRKFKTLKEIESFEEEILG